MSCKGKGVISGVPTLPNGVAEEATVSQGMEFSDGPMEGRLPDDAHALNWMP